MSTPAPPPESPGGVRVIRPEALASAASEAEALATEVELDPAARSVLQTVIARLSQPGATLFLRASEPFEAGRFVEVIGVGSDAPLDDLPCTHDAWTAPGSARVAMARPGQPSSGPTSYGLLAVPYPGERISGDGMWVHDRGTHLRFAIVDGLGHGAGAHAATRAAVRALDEAPDRALDRTLPALHEALRATRGAAIGLGEIDRKARTLEWIGVGNIAGLLCDPRGAHRSVASHNGTLGQGQLRARSMTYDWTGCAVFHSDGIAAQWQLSRYPLVERHHPALLPALLLRDHVRRDDATVLTIHDR